jgi:putative phosphoribosyl transferase
MTSLRDRRDGGRRLSERLAILELERPLVLALPRGGVPVAAEIAAALGAPLDVLVARKLGVPWRPELAMGAVAEGGVVVLDRRVIQDAGVTDEEIRRVMLLETHELQRRVALYRGGPLPDVRGRNVILVDDGLATGCTARAALRALRRAGAGRAVLAAPVAAAAAARTLAPDVDLIAVLMPAKLGAIAAWYDDFAPVADAEVVALLRGAYEVERAGAVAGGAP